MQIGIVAKKIGLSVDTIRFYRRNGLLPRPPRSQGGLRRFAQNEVETLAFIRRVQGLGFKLSEIRGLLRLRGDRLQPCAPGAAAFTGEANRRTAKASRSPQAGARTAIGPAQLQ